MGTVAKPTTVRFDETDKRRATELLDSMGLSFNTYLNLAVKQLINKRRIPFAVEAPDEVPNEVTQRAMVEAEAKELGLIPDDAPAFVNPDAAMAFLDE